MPFRDSWVRSSSVLFVLITCLLTARLLSTSVLPWKRGSTACIDVCRYGNITVPESVFILITLPSNGQYGCFQPHQSWTSLRNFMALVKFPFINYWWDLIILENVRYFLWYSSNTAFTSFCLFHVRMKDCHRIQIHLQWEDGSASRLQWENKFTSNGKTAQQVVPCGRKDLVPWKVIFCWLSWWVEIIFRVRSPISILLSGSWWSLFLTFSCANFLEQLSDTPDFKNRRICLFTKWRHSL